MNNFSIKKSVSCAKVEYVKWITNPRMIILAVMAIFMYNFALKPLVTNAQLMDMKLNVLEPFIAVANSQTVMLIIPLIFLTLISDYPKIDTNTIFYIQRIGRYNWLIGQLIKLVMMALSFLALIFICTVVPMLFVSEFSNGWSTVVTGFQKFFPEKSSNEGAQLLQMNLYMQVSVFQAAFYSYWYIFLYLMIIGMFLLLFSLIKKKSLGLLICGGVISFGAALCTIGSKLMWAFPMANSVIWLHYSRYFNTPIVSFTFTNIYFAIAVCGLLILNFVSTSRFNYDNVSEVCS